jgi:hypothetical protein
VTGSNVRRLGMTSIEQIVSWIAYIILIGLASVSYRLGGASPSDFPRLPKWLVKSSTRDVGVPLVSILAMWILGKYHWSLWICFPLMWGALTTYWKVLNKYFGKPTSDCYWFNYLAHGLGIGLALIPYGVYTHTLIGVIVRSIILGTLMMVTSYLFDNVDLEEGSRGTEIVGTLWII